MGNNRELEKIGLYIHFPFCALKCPYCHFYSIPFDKGRFERWVEGLKREASLRFRAGLEFDTLYMGGGTPSLLGSADLFRVLDALNTNRRLDIKEFTLEANPDIEDDGIIRGWRDAGVDRLSIGIQSFDDRVLGILGRAYTARQAEDFSGRVRNAGFANIGLDLMIGVPGETRKSLRRTLDTVRRIAPEHVSLYLLENIEGLPFESFLRHRPPDEDAVVKAHDFMVEELREAGLARYEISNFARPGRECRHNLKYWLYEPFLGLGPSAGSHLGAVRWLNVPDLETWASALDEGGEVPAEIKSLSPAESLKEALIFGLRMVDGICLSRFKKRFGADVLQVFEREIRDLQDEGLILVAGDSLRIPEDQFLVSNAILSRF